VFSNAGLKMTINCSLEEVESLLINGGLRKTMSHCLVEVLILLLSGLSRKTTNQYGGLGMTTNQLMLTFHDRLLLLD
jgi:hypothetical protein